MPLTREKPSQQRSTSNPERARDAVLVRKPAARADVPDVPDTQGPANPNAGTHGGENANAQAALPIAGATDTAW
jgi:hypothetical protein